MMKCIFTVGLVMLSIISFAEQSAKGFKLLQKDKTEKAYAHFLEIIEEDDNCIGCYYGLAQIISNKNNLHYDLEEAYKSIHRAAELAKEKKRLTELQEVSFSKSDIKKSLDKIEFRLLEELKRLRDLSKLNEFRESHPDLTNQNPLFELIHELAFQKAESHHNVKEYSWFIDTYPEAAQVSRAIELRNLLSYNELLLIEKTLLQKDSLLKATDFKRKMAEAATEKEHLLVEQKESEAQKITLIVLLIGALVILVIVGVAYKNIKKAKAKVQNQKVKIELQKNKIQEANTQIMDSLNYARFIQGAILPSTKSIKSSFGDAFIFFKPKDVVSGDFYWFAEIDGKKIIAAVDCTGHGVPGALMSMIGNTLLNQIVKIKKITDPAIILNELRKHVIYSLNSEEEVHDDGMDIALCVIDENKAEFAGAFNPLIHIRNELTVIKADRMPIGRHFKKEKIEFVKHSIELQKGDRLYMFSDGFADQFGGEADKKYTSKRFKKFLIEIYELPGVEQEKLLEDEFNSWRGDYDQLDDILVIGIAV